MQQALKDFVALVRDCVPIVRPIYQDRKVCRVDVVLDPDELKLPTGSAATAICLDTLEPVEFPRNAIAELHRVTSSARWNPDSQHQCGLGLAGSDEAYASAFLCGAC